MSVPTSLDSLPDEVCAWCGREYETGRWWQKYCSEACRHASRAAFTKQERATIRAGLTCQHCGEPIRDARRTDQRYCSTACRGAAAWERGHGPIAAVRCVDCGEPIPGALRRDTKRCLACQREFRRKQGRERARRNRAKNPSGDC